MQSAAWPLCQRAFYSFKLQHLRDVTIVNSCQSNLSFRFNLLIPKDLITCRLRNGRYYGLVPRAWQELSPFFSDINVRMPENSATCSQSKHPAVKVVKLAPYYPAIAPATLQFRYRYLYAAFVRKKTFSGIVSFAKYSRYIPLTTIAPG